MWPLTTACAPAHRISPPRPRRGHGGITQALRLLHQSTHEERKIQDMVFPAPSCRGSTPSRSWLHLEEAKRCRSYMGPLSVRQRGALSLGDCIPGHLIRDADKKEHSSCVFHVYITCLVTTPLGSSQGVEAPPTPPPPPHSICTSQQCFTELVADALVTTRPCRRMERRQATSLRTSGARSVSHPGRLCNEGSVLPESKKAMHG
ncbi:hypothetical protein BAUCODRAFT_274992 [Baudoinia panamericana UAMH 10762]|uniref:Uncharacterized protein n=1 Tax=Baudoinia panamericana (strain UAMH 10762) TaxID=717646 RepID=M2ML35_BAUPA|nr:uncharacterized protein BAUCODRAFT_274992 [Baudoinia panamericana UAMH 10762]EMC92063.1 hypothetical protein BAUCODRAFT_274992 [Baudoinia panamericana UAMH 10762]